MKTKFFFLACFFWANTIKAQNLNCNNWLSTPSNPSAVNIGDLDVSGNQLTVEALVYQTAINQTFNTGDIVSKHRDPANVNYLLRSSNASITTNNGFFETPSICDINVNQTYHVAMVYDGVTLKFYRNGFLMSQVPATGNLVQNNFNTRVGFYDFQFHNTQFFGFINEVRIWNVARTQTDLRSNMFDLSNPTSQTGLLAYYTFNSLNNRQGNSAWNGTLNGNAGINAIISNCTYISDSCGVIINPPADCSDICYWKVTGNNITRGNNILGTISNHDIRIKTNAIDRGIVTSTGNLGWNTQNPTAIFHNNGTVRLENLPNGVGNALVVDPNGNVMVAQSIIYRPDDAKINDEVELLKKEIEKLKLQLEEIKRTIVPTSFENIKKSGFKLYQNVPNPATSNTIIRYFLPEDTGDSYITIKNMSGSHIKSYKISNLKDGSITIEKSALPAGTYIYSLISDGIVMDSKTMLFGY